MFVAALSVDLPSEVPPPPSTVQKVVAWVLGRKDKPDEALQHLLQENLTLFEGFLRAFADAGFDDIVAVVIDGKPIYVDVAENVGDLQAALEKTAHSGALNEGYSIMRVTFSRIEGGLRVLGELRAQAKVEEGQAEVRIRLSAREDATDPVDDEGPKEYAARVRAYIHDEARVQGHLKAVQARVDRLAEAIPKRIAGAAVVSTAPVTIRIIAIGPRQVGRLRHLVFGETRRRAVNSALPNYEQIGAYDDPLAHHYYSPYQDLFDWIALGEVLAGRWSSPELRVMHPSGRTLFRGDQGTSYDPSALEVPRNAVRVNAEGNLVVDASIPHVEALEVPDADSPHRPGWAGEEWTDDLDDDNN